MQLKARHLFLSLLPIALCALETSAQKADSIPAPENFFELSSSSLLSDSVYNVYLDTTLDETEDQITNLSGNQLSLGNYGQVRLPLLYSPDYALGLNLHSIPLAEILTIERNPKFYNVSQPYTQVHYQNGLIIKMENVGFIHTQNINKNWNVAAAFERLRSDGIYQQQSTQHTTFDFSSRFISTSKRFENRTYFKWNKNILENNGGFLNRNDFVLLDNQQVLNRQSYNMRFDALTTTTQAYELGTESIIHFGKKKIRTDTIQIPETDTTTKDSAIFTPYLSTYNGSLSWKTSLSSNNETINDHNVGDSCCYPETVPFITDTIKNQQFWFTLNNELDLTYLIGKDSGFHIAPGLTVLHSHTQLTQSFMVDFNYQRYPTYHLNNLTVKAALPIQFNKSLNVEGAFQRVVAGFNTNDQYLSANTSIKISSLGTFQGGFVSAQKKPHFRSLFYRGGLYSRDNRNTFDQIKSQQIFGTLTDKEGRISLSFSYLSQVNLPYLDTLNTVRQSPLTVNILKASINGKISTKHFGLETNLTYQNNLSNAIVYLPEFVVTADAYWERRLFKNELLARFGAEGNFFTAYQAPQYSAETGFFQLQTNHIIPGYGTFNPYFSGKIDRTRFFIKTAHLNAPFSQGYYFSDAQHPITDFHLIIGFDWTFLN